VRKRGTADCAKRAKVCVDIEHNACNPFIYNTYAFLDGLFCQLMDENSTEAV